MNFVSTSFLAFFVIVFAGYWLLQVHRARMIWLLVASAVFYMSWNPWLIGLIAFSASVDYLAALAHPLPKVRIGPLHGLFDDLA